MKSHNFLNVFIMVTMAIAIASCSNSKNDDSSPQNENNSISSGSWKVSEYNDSGKDETYHFSGYTFNFASDGTLTSTNGSNTVTGNWSMGNDDSKTKLIIDFGLIEPHDDLSDDWSVIEKNSSIIRLQDVSGGNGGVDLLTFTR